MFYCNVVMNLDEISGLFYDFDSMLLSSLSKRLGNTVILHYLQIYSQISMRVTARGACTSLVSVGLANL